MKKRVSKRTLGAKQLYTAFITARFISYDGSADSMWRPITKKWVTVLGAPSREAASIILNNFITAQFISLSRWICSTHSARSLHKHQIVQLGRLPRHQNEFSRIFFSFSSAPTLTCLLFSSRPTLTCRWTKWSWSSTCRPASTWTRRSTSSSSKLLRWRFLKIKM